MTTSRIAPTGRVYMFGIGDRIRAAREQSGLDQTQLATTSGLSRQSISAYERGMSRPRRPALAAIALATGFDYRWLETGATPEPAGLSFLRFAAVAA